MVFKNQLGKLEKSVGGYRNLGSQVLAAMAPNFAVMALEMGLVFSTIVIPDVLNSDGALSLSDSEASWFGSAVFVAQPIGALVSVPMLDYFGRKKSNYLSNIPHIIAWTLMYFAWNLPSLYLANILLGLGVGILETPLATYLGELSDPSLRGSLIMFNQVFSGAGMLSVYALGTVVNWRHAALIGLIIPISSMVVAVLVPDSPVWLLSQGKDKEAVKALRFLRGWTSEDHVKKEFNELVRYTKATKACVICSGNKELTVDECKHIKMNFVSRNVLKCRYLLLCKQTLRPIIFIVMFFVFYVMSGLPSLRPNLVNVCSAFGMPGDPKKIVLVVGLLIFITCIVQTAIIKTLGKRKTVLISAFGCGICCTALSAYAKMNLDESVFSFNTTTFTAESSYVPLVLLYLLAIFFGMYIPWVMIGEVFPFRSRALAQGVAVTIVYILEFIGSKTFLDFEIHLRLWGTLALYAGFNFIGTIYLYLFTPETEGKSLEEIESYYNDDFRIFADDPFINCFRKSKKKSNSIVNANSDLTTTKL